MGTLFVVVWMLFAVGALVVGIATDEIHEAATFVMAGVIMAKLSGMDDYS